MSVNRLWARSRELQLGFSAAEMPTATLEPYSERASRVLVSPARAGGNGMALGSIVYRERRVGRALRRVCDVTLALVALVVALPILLLAALAIALDDGAPVLFKQKRVGRFERCFTIYKLRTMRANLCVDGVSPHASGDQRITRVGKWLRRFSIDELPQLVNVLRGEMSIVGPRPEMPFIVEGYESWQHVRHLVTPGITGLWQTKCRSTVPLYRPEATSLDIEYIRRASPLFDIELIGRTVYTLISTRGAF
ncbi:MAG: sugar transferase [Vulcanimicrobiaceae bacterium]